MYDNISSGGRMTSPCAAGPGVPRTAAALVTVLALSGCSAGAAPGGDAEPTAVAETSTTVSPGTTSPTSTLVSSMMATPAMTVRSTGSTLCTASSNHVSTSFTASAYGAAV